MESLLKNLKEHVTCSICLDTFTDPKTIICLHTFCCECLKKHALISQRNGKFRCPECQAEVGLPEANRFDKLPTSFHHNSLLSLLPVQQSGDGNEISCSICKKKSAEISYCFECAKFMCSDCVNAHDLFKNTALTEGHKVTPVKQFQAKDYEALIKTQSFCSQQYHEREVTRFFCLKCQTCVCQICINTDHKTHKVEPLEKAADSEKANILARAELMKEKSKVCSGVIHQFEQTELDLQTNISNIKREVSQAADQMIAKIGERKREVIAVLENTRVSREEKLRSTKTQVQSLLKQINQAVESAETLVQRYSNSHFMQSKPNLEQRFKDLENAPVPTLPVNSFLKFFSTSEPESLNLGFTATSELVVGLAQDFRVGVEAEFEVKRVVEAKEKALNVEVLMEPANKVGNLLTCEKEDGDFLVKFTPKVPGTFNITVKINGKKFPASPYTVQVKEQLIQVVGELEFKGETLEEPCGIAVNSKGVIAVADTKKHCILMFDREGKFIRKVGCYGNNAGQLNHPRGVTYLNNNPGQLNHPRGVTYLNNNPGQLNHPHGVTYLNINPGQLNHPYDVTYLNNNAEQLNYACDLTYLNNNAGQLNHPCDVTYLNDDNILVADELNHRIQQFNVNTGTCVRSFGKKGTGDGEFLNPSCLCIDGEGRVIVADHNNNRVQVLSQDGKPMFKFGDSGPGKLDRPTSCIYHQDRFFVSDSWNNCLKVFDNLGKFLYKIGELGEGDGQLSFPWGLCLGKSDNHYSLLVCNYNRHRVDQFTVEGCFTGKTVDNLQMNPRAITKTPDGHILVSDWKANKIYILK